MSENDNARKFVSYSGVQSNLDSQLFLTF